ncbi:poly polymerase catalytic domain-containing protein [Aspergillus karnatakaensis]|uniref:poly polymerase catalytic domain-containing protein n=1 Tax=Aspergillus karnatakaensis TaxID=1810916 RepID=UPI003CCE1CE5
MSHNDFRDLVISIGGHYGQNRHSKYADRIRALGATYVKTVTARCTHLIATPREVQNGSRRVMRAKRSNRCEIVSLQWLDDSESLGKPQPASQYRLTANNPIVSQAATLPTTPQIASLMRMLAQQEEDALLSFTGQKKPKLEGVPYAPDLKIPPHPDFPLKDEYSVYLNMFGLPWDAKLIRAEANTTHNKVYHIQLLVHRSRRDDFVTWFTYGNIGGSLYQYGYTPCRRSIAKQFFEALFVNKVGYSWFQRFTHAPIPGRYAFMHPEYVLRNPAHDPWDARNAQHIRYNIPPPVVEIPAAVQKTLSLILNKDQIVPPATAVSYDARKLPLGNLSKQTLRKGYEILKLLEFFVDHPCYAAMKYPDPQNHPLALSTQYFRTIPHAIGATRLPVISQQSDIDKEMELLDDLANTIIANEITAASNAQPLNRALKEVGLEQMTPLESTCNEFSHILKYFQMTTRGWSTEQCKVVNIFRIRRKGEDTRFQSSIYATLPRLYSPNTPTLSDRRLLWHGSGLTNFAKILSQGLLIRPQGVAYHGSALGNGIYFSDAAGISLGYTGIATSTGEAVLLLCDVELGSPATIHPGVGRFAGRQRNTISTHWHKGTPAAFLADGASIHSDLKGASFPITYHDPQLGRGDTEYAIYDPAQIDHIAFSVLNALHHNLQTTGNIAGLVSDLAAGSGTAGLRRERPEDDEAPSGSEGKKIKLSGVPYSPGIIIPAPKECPFRFDYSIAVDSFGHPWDARLSRSYAKGRRNEFYRILLLVDKTKTKFMTWRCYGVYGQKPRPLTCSPCDEDTAKANFEEWYFDKVGYTWWQRLENHPLVPGKYAFLPPGYVHRDQNEDPFDVANAKNICYTTHPPQYQLHKHIQELLELVLQNDMLLCDTTSPLYDEKQILLGKLSMETILEGRKILNMISDVIKAPIRAAHKHRIPVNGGLKILCDQYFSLIPHVFSKKQQPMCKEEDIDKEVRLLNDLTDAVIASTIIKSVEGSYVHPLEQAMHDLKLEGIDHVSPDTSEFNRVSQYFRLKFPIHPAWANLKIVHLFRLRRPWEEKRFQASPAAKSTKGNRRLLWHGSPRANFAGILSEGLRICPGGKAPNGSTLGKGIYFSDSAMTSLMYTHGPRPDMHSLLLLYDVELGDHVNVVDEPVIYSRPAGNTSTQ